MAPAGPGVNIDLGDLIRAIPDTLKSLIEIAKMPFEYRLKRRQEVYREFVVPLDRAMRSIYSDYQQRFKRLIELLDNKTNPDEIIRILESDRLIHVQTRREVRARAQVIKETPPLHARESTIQAFVGYSGAVNNFLLGHGGNPGEATYSWYTTFIDIFKSRVQNGRDPFDFYSEISTNQPPSAAVRDAVNRAVQEHLPDAWELYDKARETLRVQLRGRAA
jgi:hypothetical protein